MDATSVHPESYEAALKLMEKLGLTMEDIKKAQQEAAKKQPAAKPQGTLKENSDRKRRTDKQQGMVIRNTNTAMGKALAAAMSGAALKNDQNSINGGKSTEKTGAVSSNASSLVSTLEKRVKDKKKLAEELGIGEITLADILKELEKPARDPRDNMPAPILRSDVMDMKDLKPGMILKGTVRNVIDFGVFVDIGVHQDGLVHISQITDRFIKHPLEAVSVGDIVDVQVISVDAAKKRIALTMKISS